MDKLLTYAGRTDRGVFNFLIDHERGYLTKTACEYHPTIAAYINSARKIPGKTQVLLTALGAGEYWGDNSNSDWFGEDQLAHEGADYGFKTFEHYAKVFKHHCFVKDTAVVAEQGLVRIQDISIGDRVLTHKGRYREVLNVFRREADGNFVTMNVQGLGEDVECTAKHRFLAVRQETLICPKHRKSGRNFCTFFRHPHDECHICGRARIDLAPEWVDAQDIRPGDYITQTINQELPSHSGNTALGTLCGLFLADGCFSKRGGVKTGLQLTFSKLRLDLHEKMLLACDSLGYEVGGPYIHKENNTATFSIHGHDLANLIYEHCGEYSDGKKITSDLVEMLGADGCRALIGAYIDGDGSLPLNDEAQNAGIVRIRSCNASLLHTVRIMCLNLGIPASYNLDCPPSRKSGKIIQKLPSGVVSIPASAAPMLSQYSLRCAAWSREVEKAGSRAFHYANMVLHRVRSVTLEDRCEEVFNIEVAEDNSYQVWGLNAHNCNKDPKKSYGDVILAVYNSKFHRVELIVAIDNEKAPDIVEKIESGENVWWSMGCLRPDAQIWMEDFTTKKVSEIVSGDRVINANGTVSTVDYPHSHLHNGKWFKVSVSGFSDEDIEPTTEEHPWLVKTRQDMVCKRNKQFVCTPRRENRKVCEKCSRRQASVSPKWRRADELGVGDYVGTPIIKGESSAPEDRYAFLAGMYLAQGHVTTEGNRIILTVPISAKGDYEKLKSMYPEYSWIWRPRNDAAAADIESAIGKDLCRSLVEDCGAYASCKKLSKDVMLWPIESQKIFIGAYHDGDGCTYDGSAYFSTCNKFLANQVFHVLLRIGCISAVQKIIHKPSKIVKKSTVEYQIRVGQGTSHILSGYSKKCAELKDPKWGYGGRFIEDGHLWSRIDDIDVTECQEEVYNIAICSGDYDTDSYVVSNIALHNCKIPYDVCNICGNKAPNRKFYCDHLKYELGTIHPGTGRKVYAINIKPKFFDISYVIIPADKTAIAHRKVAFAVNPGHIYDANGRVVGSAEAAEKEAAEQKAAAIIKEIPGSGAPASQDLIDNPVARDAVRSAIAIQEREPKLPNNVIDQLCSSGTLPQILATLRACAIMPKPQEFQRLYLVSKGLRSMADDLDRLNVCFHPDHTNPTAEHFAEIGADSDASSDLASLLEPYFESRSNTAPLLLKRVTIMVKQASYQQEQPPTYVKADTRADHSVLKTLGVGAAIYAAVQAANSDSVRSTIDFLSKHPAFLAALGLGAVAMYAHGKAPEGGMRGRFSGTEPVVADSTDLYDRIERMRERPYTKLGSASNDRGLAMAKRLLIGVPAVHMVSAALQRHRDSNPSEEEGRISGFIRKNPNLMSGIVVADALLAAHGKGSYRLTRPLVEGQRAFLKGASLNLAAGICEEGLDPAVKSASVQDYVSSSLIWPLAMGTGNLPGRIVGSLFDQAVLDAGTKLVEKRKQRQQQGVAGKP